VKPQLHTSGSARYSTDASYIRLEISTSPSQSLRFSPQHPSRSHNAYKFATDALTVKDKANHAVVLDKQTADKLNKDVQSYRLITVATLVDRLKINGSLAREALADLEEKGQIKKVVGHSKLSIYSTSRPATRRTKRHRFI
jgi:small subunit ribosomal protein S25e